MAEYKKQYNPNRNSDWNYSGKNWKLSRSKIELFIECPRCFYLDNKLGTARPRGPAFTLNVAVDELFKREFDFYRRAQKPHPIMVKNKIEAVPYKDNRMEEWRDNFTGIIYKDPDTGFTISGAVDDIWEKADGTLLVVDYKATAKESEIKTLSDSSWEESYKRQMGVYQWLLRKNGFVVDDTGYFVYANARVGEKQVFADTLNFETTLVPCLGETNWMDSVLLEIKKTLDQETLPKVGESCEYCAYREASGKKLQSIHYANKNHS